MKMVTSLGREFLRDFAAVYPQIAEEAGPHLHCPSSLPASPAKEGSNQEDGIHPTAEGYRIINRQPLSLSMAAIKKNGKG